MSIIEISKLHPGVVFRNTVRTTFPYTTSHLLDKYSKDLFPNQVSFGHKIFSSFLNRSIHTIMALALTQSGKTGSMLSIIHHFVSSPILALPLQNVFVITGHSSIDWLQQTRERFPPCLSNNIFHRNTLKTFSKKLTNLTNVLILIDETQVACLQSQSIQSALNKAGITANSIYRRDIKFVLVSATPKSCIKRFIPLRPGYDLIYMNPSPGYTSIFNLYDRGLVFQCKDLCGFDKKTQQVLPHALDNIREIQIGSIPKYHIIRTHHSFMHDITINNFKTVFGNKYRYLSMPNIDILSRQPSIHTFIFIKETLRCAKTIDKTYLGILYDRFSKASSDDAIIQGLAGRATGYHSKSITIYTNISSIVRYRDLWDNKFSTITKGKTPWDF